jgi:hypothetical protein
MPGSIPIDRTAGRKDFWQHGDMVGVSRKRAGEFWNKLLDRFLVDRFTEAGQTFEGYPGPSRLQFLLAPGSRRPTYRPELFQPGNRWQFEQATKGIESLLVVESLRLHLEDIEEASVTLGGMKAAVRQVNYTPFNHQTSTAAVGFWRSFIRFDSLK